MIKLPVFERSIRIGRFPGGVRPARRCCRSDSSDDVGGIGGSGFTQSPLRRAVYEVFGFTKLRWVLMGKRPQVAQQTLYDFLKGSVIGTAKKRGMLEWPQVELTDRAHGLPHESFKANYDFRVLFEGMFHGFNDKRITRFFTEVVRPLLPQWQQFGWMFQSDAHRDFRAIGPDFAIIYRQDKWSGERSVGLYFRDTGAMAQDMHDILDEVRHMGRGFYTYYGEASDGGIV